MNIELIPDIEKKCKEEVIDLLLAQGESKLQVGTQTYTIEDIRNCWEDIQRDYSLKKVSKQIGTDVYLLLHTLTLLDRKTIKGAYTKGVLTPEIQQAVVSNLLTRPDIYEKIQAKTSYIALADYVGERLLRVIEKLIRRQVGNGVGNIECLFFDKGIHIKYNLTDGSKDTIVCSLTQLIKEMYIT